MKLSLEKKGFILEFEEEEDRQEVIHNAMVYTLVPSNFGNSMSKMDALFSKVDFNEKAKFWLLRLNVMKVLALCSLTTYCATTTYRKLKKVVKDLKSDTKAFRSAKAFPQDGSSSSIPAQAP